MLKLYGKGLRGAMTPLKHFTKAYIICAFWATNDESTPDGGEPLDKNYKPCNLADETRHQMEVDCRRFFAENAKLIEMSTASDRHAQAGHDFWLSRSGHGSGFFDGNWGGAEDELQKAAQKFGEFNLYVGDDGKVYGDKG